MSPFAVRRLLFAMALVDLLVFGGWITREEMARTGERIELPVYGYDPRDLLSGHYVQFRLVAERETLALLRDGTSDPKSLSGGTVSVCLERGTDGMHHVTHVRGLNEGCAFITGSTEPYRVDFGVDRFYVDERHANEVSAVVEGPSTYLVATIDASGTIHVIDLVASGKPMAPAQ